jgi:transposase-like protein
MEETKTSPFARRYPEELRERAVRQVQETIAQGVTTMGR